ncbi:MAG: DNA polymerase I [Clostridia bacterium]|nr:DNA polymerase I [Clostridia bacterium]
MGKLLLIDGNSIMNRAFYGIMSSKMLTTKDGTYTNAVYGFLAILFKVEDELKPDHIAVTFDLKGPTARHEMYDGYKANRKGMPNELAAQMPIIKDVLSKMNIKIIEKQGYEGDDILGTFARIGEQQGLDVVILSGDRDTFQLATDKVTIHIPRTKAGKTEVDDFDRAKVVETYEVEPKQLIEVKGLMGDSSDNIPGVPGVGEKTAYKIIQEYKSIDNLYAELEKGEAATIKGKIRERIIENKELAYLSRTLGEINCSVPVDDIKVSDLELKEWNKSAVFDIFKELNFKRFIERFGLSGGEEVKDQSTLFELVEDAKASDVINIIKSSKECIFYIYKNDDKTSKNIIKKKFKSLAIYDKTSHKSYYLNISKDEFVANFKEIFESKEIAKLGFKLNDDYVFLKEMGIKANNISFDAEIAAYIINPGNKYTLEDLAMEYLGIDVNEFLEDEKNDKKTVKGQMNLFDAMGTPDAEQLSDDEKSKICMYAFIIGELHEKLMAKIEEYNSTDLFNNIEMPLLEVLAEMQLAGMHADKDELTQIGAKLKVHLDELTKDIYDLAGEEFNINSTKQLGVILFEKLQLPVKKKTKTGYSTDVDILEKLKKYHPIIEKILDYRSLMKLNSTYVEGLLPYINENDDRIHSFFHQTITATGRISSTEPNLQNIPTRIDFGKQIRKVFKAREGYVFIDADYSQIELRVLAHISQDENMMHAFLNGEDIHKQAASKVLGIPIEEVTKEQRSSAKAVNFGIVYGISDFGLADQLGISRKEAKNYIDQYLEKYSGIDKFMKDIVEQAKKDGYVETLFHRRRLIPELSSNNFMVRQFGARVAMNTPIQGTAADIMKIAMVSMYKALQDSDYDAKIVLQIHDELMIECKKEDAENVEKLLKECMESAIQMSVPLLVEAEVADNWYEVK